MAVKRNVKTKKWDCYFRYTDSTGKTIAKHKRGFDTQREAKEWEREYLLKNTSNLEMTFESFIEIYMEEYKVRHKLSSYQAVKYSLPKYEYFYKLKMCDIDTKIIRHWQNLLLKENYSAAYLISVQKTLSAIFNNAVKVYGLKENPLTKVGVVTNHNHAAEKEVWTVEEFNTFINSFEGKNMFYISLFYLLFYTGARVGEILALTFKDINFDENTININKTVTRIKRNDIITPPKTLSSIRTVDVPENVMKLLKRYTDSYYKPDEDSRVYPVTREIVRRTMQSYIKKSSVKKIRIHDLRHSHVSLLINMGVNIFEISKRIGHADASITSRVYAHVYADSGKKIANLLGATILQPE